jgi:hypothetical protein
VFGLSLIFLVVGCGTFAPTRPDEVSTAPHNSRPAAEIEGAPKSPEPPPAEINMPSGETQPATPAPVPPSPHPATATQATSPVTPLHRPSAKPRAGSDQSSGAVAPAISPPAAVPDLAALEQRLRDTHAIGVFTKLSLKNQVDDLLERFRSTYRAQTPVPTSDLRQRYDLLLLKVVTLLQDNDPALARAISSSREALWGILSDPEKFANIQL